MLNNFLKLLTLFSILLLAGISCSQISGDDNENDFDDDQIQASTSVVFPHAEKWRQADNHGVFAYLLYIDGTDHSIGESCRNCHGSNLRGGDTGISCYTSNCHTVFPHKKNWTQTSSSNFHGLSLTTDKINKTCATECHGTDLSGGLSNVSCYTCHKLYPHVSNNYNISDYFDFQTAVWSDFNVHGAYVKSLNAVESGTCATTCHGTDLSGGLSDVACADCHATYPHVLFDSYWSNNHRNYVSLGSDTSCASSGGCHTNQNQGSKTVVQSCTDLCHQP